VGLVNGTIAYGARTYELGEASFFLNLQKYGLDGTQALHGDPTAPSFVFEATTSRPGHRFRITAVFKYEPDKDIKDGVPYGFHFTGGTVRLLEPPSGLNAERPVTFVHDLVSAVKNGEAEFRRVETFAIGARAAVDQAAAGMRERGELP